MILYQFLRLFGVECDESLQRMSEVLIPNYLKTNPYSLLC
jgi:hypothetical protein